MECYKGKEVIDLNPETFREQLLFYIFCLYSYRHHVGKKNPSNFQKHLNGLI